MIDPAAGPLPESPVTPSLPDVCGLEYATTADPTSPGLQFPGLQFPGVDGPLDVGAPEADLSGDGFMEAVTLHDDRGLTVYTDTDGDGAVDHLSTVRFDGSYDSWRLTGRDGGGTDRPEPAQEGTVAPARWERIDHGRL